MNKVIFQSIPKIISMGYCIFDPVWKTNIHKSDNIELLFVKNGSTQLVTKQNSISAEKDEFLLIPSKTQHRDDFDLEQDFEVFLIHFQWDIEDAFFELISNENLVAIQERTKVEISNIIHSLSLDITNARKINFFIANTRLLTILQLILRDIEILNPSIAQDEDEIFKVENKFKIMKKAKQYIDEYYKEILNIENIARAINISPYYLSHIFSEEKGTSLYAYLISVRMNKAKGMLIDGIMNVSEVANAVGYSDSNYFSKYFKRYFGNSPKYYLGFVQK